jgi:hypothetical protein
MVILVYTLKSIAFAITEPYMAILLFMLALILYRKNVKTTLMQKMIVGESVDNAFELTISQVVIGIFAGTAASLIMSYLGVVFDQNSAVELLFLTSVLFMFYNPRFVCFAYSGAALGLISILLSYAAYLTNNPAWDVLKINIPALMTMVAVLHLVEGVVVLIDGKRGSMPVFTNREDKIVGGFAFQRYWAFPIAIFFIIQDKSLVTSAWQVSMPAWWPIIKTFVPLDILKNAMLMLVPFYGVMGYNSVTFSKSKSKKVQESGLFIIGYSVILFGFAQLAALNIFFKVFVLFFSIVAHEGMLWIQREIDMNGKPMYISSGEGIMVLEVAPKSPAYEMGIKSGDTLLQINDKNIENEAVIVEAIRESSNFIWFDVKRGNGKLEQLSYSKMTFEKRLGLVLVPKNMPKESMVVKLDGTSFKDVLDKLKKKENDK